MANGIYRIFDKLRGIGPDTDALQDKAKPMDNVEKLDRMYGNDLVDHNQIPIETVGINLPLAVRLGGTGGGTADVAQSNLLRDWDFWIIENRPWTYVSSTSFSVLGDLTGIYAKGDKIKWKQSGNQYYGYITATSLAGAITTVTITGDTLSSGIIYENYYSKATSPVGHPDWFESLAGHGTGWSAVTYERLRWKLAGRVLKFQWQIEGTSNSATTELTLPVTPTAFTPVTILNYAYGQWDAGAADYSAVMTITMASTTATVQGLERDPVTERVTFAALPNAGAKNIVIVGDYEI